MTLRVLCVDDEPRVLEGLELHLGMDHEVWTAESGPMALELIESEGPFDVIISDMRMPVMDGARFLAEARRLAPESTRVLLTGTADVDTAMRGVNEGQIYRFLTKPCKPDDLAVVVRDAGELSRLRRSERELLQRTLHGCVALLSDVLTVVAPSAFHQSQRARALAAKLGPRLGVPVDEQWQLDVAAMLMSLGCVAVPPDVLQRHRRGESLSPEERGMVDAIPDAGAKLLGRIPRLERVVELVATSGETENLSMWAGEKPGLTEVFQLVVWLDASLRSGGRWDDLKARVRRRLGRAVADALGGAPSTASKTESTLRIAELRPGMELVEDVRTINGQRVIASGNVLNDALVSRLRNFAENVGLVEPVRVLAA